MECSSTSPALAAGDGDPARAEKKTSGEAFLRGFHRGLLDSGLAGQRRTEFWARRRRRRLRTGTSGAGEGGEGGDGGACSLAWPEVDAAVEGDTTALRTALGVPAGLWDPELGRRLRGWVRGGGLLALKPCRGPPPSSVASPGLNGRYSPRTRQAASSSSLGTATEVGSLGLVASKVLDGPALASLVGAAATRSSSSSSSSAGGVAAGRLRARIWAYRFPDPDTAAAHLAWHPAFASEDASARAVAVACRTCISCRAACAQAEAAGRTFDGRALCCSRQARGREAAGLAGCWRVFVALLWGGGASGSAAGGAVAPGVSTLGVPLPQQLRLSGDGLLRLDLEALAAADEQSPRAATSAREAAEAAPACRLQELVGSRSGPGLGLSLAPFSVATDASTCGEASAGSWSHRGGDVSAGASTALAAASESASVVAASFAERGRLSSGELASPSNARAAAKASATPLPARPQQREPVPRCRGGGASSSSTTTSARGSSRPLQASASAAAPTSLSACIWAAEMVAGISAEAVAMSGESVPVRVRLSPDMRRLNLEVSGEDRDVCLADVVEVLAGEEATRLLSSRLDATPRGDLLVLRLRNGHCVALRLLPQASAAEFAMHLRYIIRAGAASSVGRQASVGALSAAATATSSASAVRIATLGAASSASLAQAQLLPASASGSLLPPALQQPRSCGQSACSPRGVGLTPLAAGGASASVAPAPSVQRAYSASVSVPSAPASVAVATAMLPVQGLSPAGSNGAGAGAGGGAATPSAALSPGVRRSLSLPPSANQHWMLSAPTCASSPRLAVITSPASAPSGAPSVVLPVGAALASALPSPRLAPNAASRTASPQPPSPQAASVAAAWPLFPASGPSPAIPVAPSSPRPASPLLLSAGPVWRSIGGAGGCNGVVRLPSHTPSRSVSPRRPAPLQLPLTVQAPGSATAAPLTPVTPVSLASPREALSWPPSATGGALAPWPWAMASLKASAEQTSPMSAGRR
eukprot:TRINITY_DN16857_c1_g1_i2.p1 TRINITY_DN16857_c1_g1~~TRINITY_DN16857_c1_g1_i2.p1  ORF type:complete len:991 (+),score=193.50 TRINITY_DN16857_c1_g1_i2:50-3022(+)